MRNLPLILLAMGMAGLAVGTARADDKPKAPEAKPVKPDASKPAPPSDDPPDPQRMRPPDPPPPPPDPTPSTELLAMGKATKGTWTCKGELDLADGSTYKATFTLKVKLDLDKMWLRAELTEKKSKAQKHPRKATSYRTYDATTALWTAITVDNMGAYGTASSSGADATGKLTWEGESHLAGQTYPSRDYEEPGKKGARHLWGEYSIDGGRHWAQAYDAVCTK